MRAVRWIRTLSSLLIALPLLGCSSDPYSSWPEPETVFPYVYTPLTDLTDYEQVRVETETWHPGTDHEELGLYVTKALNHRPGAPVEVLEHFQRMRPVMPSLGDGVTLSIVGDLMWIGENWEAWALPVAQLVDGDLRIGNLETPTSPIHTTDRSEMGLYQMNSPVEMLDGLPLDVLQLNNNHILDFFEDGMLATLSEVESRGFTPTGIDEHAFVEVGERTVAVLSFNWGNNEREATTTHELFIVPFGHIHEDVDLSPALDLVRAARNTADSVVVLLHWGFEYEYFPEPHFMIIARELVAAGADVVAGQGPHVIQPAEICHVNHPEHVPGIGTCSLRTDDGQPRTAAVLYSLGNFGTFQPTSACRSGLVATISLDPDVTGLGWTATFMQYDPVSQSMPLVDLMDDPEVQLESERLDAHLGVGWKR